jgi:hypothetical protein
MLAGLPSAHNSHDGQTPSTPILSDPSVYISCPPGSPSFWVSCCEPGADGLPHLRPWQPSTNGAPKASTPRAHHHESHLLEAVRPVWTSAVCISLKSGMPLTELLGHSLSIGWSQCCLPWIGCRGDGRQPWTPHLSLFVCRVPLARGVDPLLRPREVPCMLQLLYPPS